MSKAVFTFGRMNPPTIGHEKLVNKVRAVARAHKGDPLIYLSHTHKLPKDPLEYNDKIKLAKIVGFSGISFFNTQYEKSS